MLASALELLASGSELHCTGLRICQMNFIGLADYIAFVSDIATCANLKQSDMSHLNDCRKGQISKTTISSISH